MNFYKGGRIRTFITKCGGWLRYRIRIVILKQWKKSKPIRRKLIKINIKYNCGFIYEDIRKVSVSRLGLYKRTNGDVINFILSPNVLSIENGNQPGLVNPLEYYIS